MSLFTKLVEQLVWAVSMTFNALSILYVFVGIYTQS